jgi:hypothetical protein
MENLLQAGYCEDWKYYPTLSGTPQGGIVSPILANIYLDRLDKFVEQTLIPEYTRGEHRAKSAEYNKLNVAAWNFRGKGQYEKAHELEVQYQRMPSKDVRDPDYRRLHYLRYADDWLLGFAGPIAEAEQIKEQLKVFLRGNLKLELSEEKTLITHAHSQAARFLGYEIAIQHADDKHTQGKRSINGSVQLRIPAKFIEDKSALYMKDNKPIQRPELINDADYSIVAHYQSEYRGYVQYYKLAQNIARLKKVHWTMWLSLLKTLANKHKTTVAKIKARYHRTVKLPHGLRKCIVVTAPREGKKPLVARFGGIPLKRNLHAIIQDLPTTRQKPARSELLARLLANVCEICGSTEAIQVHHVRALKDLKVKGRKEKPLWMQIMSARKRKTLVLCKACHNAIHQGKPMMANNSVESTGEP